MKKTTRRSLIASLATAALALGASVGIVNSATAAAPVAQATTASNPQWLTGYWHNFNNGSTILRINQIPQQYNLIAVAFVESIPGVPGGVTFKLESQELGGYTVAQFKADIAAVRAQGRKVVISVGGEKAHIQISTPTEAQNFAD